MAVEMKRTNTSSTKRTTKTKEKIIVQLDVETLNTMCRFVISDSAYVKKYDLIQLQRFMDTIDQDRIKNSGMDQKDRIMFIKYGLEAKLELKMNSQDAVLAFISSKFDKSIDFIDKAPLSREDINWINQSTAEMLKYNFIYTEIDNIRALCNEFSQTNMGHRGDIIPRFEKEIDHIKNEFRKLKAEDENEAMFSLRQERLDTMVTDTFNKIKAPSRKLFCGMQGVNQLTSGFESGRVYMLFGTSGVGKSLTLLNLLYQLKLYNRNYKPKDPTKTPCIILLTMENTMTETITRLFDLVSGSTSSMDNYNTVDEILNILRVQGQLSLTDDNPIDIIIKYKPNRSVATDYLYSLHDELVDSGYEPICLIQDHVKRIRAVDSDKDLRLELGNIVNELKVFASLKDIPVISNSHLNRDGATVIERGSHVSKADITRMLGKSVVGESLLMIDNLDMGIIINKEWDRDNNMYMVFSVIKKRVKNMRDYIAQPFVPGSEIRLMEDVGKPIPVFRESLRASGNLMHTDNTIRPSTYSNIINSDEMFVPDESSIFGGGVSYSSESFGNDFTPLSSDIPDYEAIQKKKEEEPPKKKKIYPIIFHDKPVDSNELLKDMESILKG